MAIDALEEATIRAFVAPARRDRLLSLLASRRRRREALDLLNHFHDWDRRFARALRQDEDLAALLLRAGAPAVCHVVSDAPDLDGKEMPLKDAIATAESHAFASLLCCLPGILACHIAEQAAPRRRTLLTRAGSAG